MSVVEDEQVLVFLRFLTKAYVHRVLTADGQRYRMQATVAGQPYGAFHLLRQHVVDADLLQYGYNLYLTLLYLSAFNRRKPSIVKRKTERFLLLLPAGKVYFVGG